MFIWNLLFAVLLTTSFLNGFLVVILGSILPDLRCHLQTDLKSLSYLFLAFALGNIPGFASAHYVITRSRLFLTIFLLVLIQSLALSVLPLVPVIYLAAVCVCIFGFNTASNISILLHLLDVYWAGSARRIYLIMSMFSAGCFCCPLILQPFLSSGHLTQKFRNHGIMSSYYISGNDTSNSSSIGVPECNVLWQYPCFLIAFIGVCVAFFYLMFHFKIKEDIPSSTYVDMTSDTDKIVPTKVHMVLLFLLFLPSFPMTFAGLLTSYGTSGSNTSLSILNMMLSVFWACSLVGRALPAFLPDAIKQHKIMWAVLIGQLPGGLLLLGTRYCGEAMLWSSCVVLGLTGGTYLPAGLAWAGQILKMNPARKSVCLTAMATGYILPYSCGYLMSIYGVEVFVYFTLILSAYSAFIFISLVCVLYFFKGDTRPN